MTKYRLYIDFNSLQGLDNFIKALKESCDGDPKAKELKAVHTYALDDSPYEVQSYILLRVAQASREEK